ncbi:MAG TPA: hypothetical protein VEX86_00575 [Longimicrobium sp.]|nr:hypothetical protein [Longimicrobium sp.]
MSWTQNDHLFAALHESGANDVMAALYAQRPRWFNYGSWLFVPSKLSPNATQLPPFLNFVHWKAHFTLPRLQFHPAPPAGSLPVAPNQFSLTTQVTATLLVPPTTLATVSLGLRAVGVPVANAAQKKMSVQFTATEIQLTSPPLPPFVSPLVTAALNFAIAGFFLPYPAFSAGAFTPVLSGPPTIQLDRLDLRGNL